MAPAERDGRMAPWPTSGEISRAFRNDEEFHRWCCEPLPTIRFYGSDAVQLLGPLFLGDPTHWPTGQVRPDNEE